MAAAGIAAKIRGTALTAIGKQCLGEDYGFDAASSVVQGPGGLAVIYTLVITGRSPLLGQPPLAHVVQIPFADPPAEAVEQAVTDAIRQLREASANLLARQNGKPPQLVSPK
jgi:hypothetical protein